MAYVVVKNASTTEDVNQKVFCMRNVRLFWKLLNEYLGNKYEIKKHTITAEDIVGLD